MPLLLFYKLIWTSLNVFAWKTKVLFLPTEKCSCSSKLTSNYKKIVTETVADYLKSVTKCHRK